MMRYIAALFFFFCLKQVSFATDSLKVGHAYRSTTSVKIDGVLAEADWQKAESHGGFIEFDPTQGLPPSQKTEFKIMYDNSAVYFAAICYDTSPDSILAELGNRDDFDLNADKIRLVLDPYNTRQGGYVFEVYASGVQLDWRFDDEEFDAVWMSAVKKNENGWICEMEIPYSAIRFPNDDIQKWAIQVARSIRRVREYDQWCTTPKSDANPFKYFANLEGIEKINAPLRLSLTPYVSMFADRAPEYDADGKYIYRNSSSYNMGADIKYGIDERFTVDMILLPDFGQVRSDNKIKNIGYQEITFDENRPFFRESSELFNKFGLFYSRRIANTPKGFFGVYDQLNAGEKVVSNPQQGKLINATKLSGRTNGGLGIGLLNAVIDNTYAVVENENGEKRKILTEPLQILIL
nr:carbohydrate binding family 9 domain-containing protein [Bacteroidota bacterium]